MKALKLLIPSLFAIGMVATPFDASAADETKAKGVKSWGTTFRDTAYTKHPKPEQAMKRGTSLEAAGSKQLGTSVLAAEGSHKGVPELSGSAAGASLALVGAGLLALAGRRKRKAEAR